MKFPWSKAENKNTEKIDYSNVSNETLLDSFKSEEWEKLNKEQRVAVVQEMENRNAAEQGRKPATVVSMNDSSSYGAYNGSNNQISIDVMNFSSYETLDTYIHEGNHAYQAYCIQKGQGYDGHTLGMMQAEMARDESGGMYNYATAAPEYDMQCSELDSNNKAADFLTSQRERYRNDPEYRAYMEERANHFKEVNSALDWDGERRIALRNNQAYNAYLHRDISEEQFYTLNQNINDTQYIDATTEESHLIGETVSEVNDELQRDYSKDSYMGTVWENTADGHEATFDYMGSAASFDDGVSMDLEGGGMENGDSMDMN